MGTVVKARAKGTASDALTRGTVRALTVLRTLNEYPNVSVSRMSQLTGIPRPALYRVLGTLCACGYVVLGESGRNYRLTALVQTLSSGFREDQTMQDVVRPVLLELQRHLLWPVDYVAVCGSSVIIREETWTASPLTYARPTARRRLPMLKSASGRAYLAFCQPDERRIILDALANSNDPEDGLIRRPENLNHILQTTRANGYGEQWREIEDALGCIAVPVMHGQRVIAMLGVPFFANSVTPSQMASRHLLLLRDAANRIERGIVSAGLNWDRNGLT